MVFVIVVVSVIAFQLIFTGSDVEGTWVNCATDSWVAERSFTDPLFTSADTLVFDDSKNITFKNRSEILLYKVSENYLYVENSKFSIVWEDENSFRFADDYADSAMPFCLQRL